MSAWAISAKLLEMSGKAIERFRKGDGVSELHEVVTWLIYAIAAVVVIAAAAAAVLFGLALRFAAEFLRELGDDREEGGTRQHADDGPGATVRAKG